MLFLFMMSAFDKALENEWEEKGMRQAEFAIVLQDNLDNQVGHIIGHGLDKLGYKKGIMFKIIQILYLDEGAFIFESQTFLIKGVNIIHLHFKKIGMEMHVGRNEKASKTECIMFSPPRCFNPKIYRRRKRASAPPLKGDTSSSSTHTNPPILEHAPPDSNPSSLELKESFFKKKKKRKKKKLYRQTAKDIREDFVYNFHPETQRVKINDGYVEFTKHFPYIGSFISYNLKDNFDISKRISKAFQNMRMLKNVCEDSHIDLYSKYLFFMAMPLHLLLWGCKSWAFNKSSSDDLNIFIH